MLSRKKWQIIYAITEKKTDKMRYHGKKIDSISYHGKKTDSKYYHGIKDRQYALSQQKDR